MVFLINMTQARNYLLTLNPAVLEYYEDIKQYFLRKTNFQYLICCEHVGNVSEKHYHMYVQFSKPSYVSFNLLHGAHVDKCKGSAQANIAYVKAEDDKHRRLGIQGVLIDEEGEPLRKGGNFTIGYLRDCDDDAEIPGVLYNTYNRIKNERRNRISLGSWRKRIQVYYIQGPSKIGKSEKAEELIRTWYNDRGVEDEDEMYFDELKFDQNGFYAGVNQDFPTEVAVFDDFRAGQMKPEEFINLIDYRVHNMNIKGGSWKNRYKLIIFTSVQRLSSIYRNVEDYERREQWERRINLIDMYPPREVCVGGLPVGEVTNFNNFENYQSRLRNLDIDNESCISNI